MISKLLLSCSLAVLLLSCQGKQEPPVVNKIEVPKEILKTQTGQVQKGQGLFQALKNVSISDDTLALKLINELRDEVEFSKLKVGDELQATFNQDNKLISFSFSQNPAEKHSLKFNNETQTWDYSFLEEPTFWNARILEGELRASSTLQEDLINKGLPRSVVAEVVNVLLCKVNFRMDARMGDRYKVLLNERMFNDSVLETQVLYTSYKGRRAGHSEAYFYQDEEKSSTYTAHYTTEGEALIRSGLRYPLSRLHIRSGFGFRRHPVTGRRAMHRGVDLQGRVGTPVHAVADGIIVESTFNRFAGNKVAIRHRDGSTSYYFHLKKRRVRKGQKIISYQVIGTVGATGRVTGPHLHFGFKKPNGSWMNPMNKRMIATPKLQGRRLQNLKKQIAQTKALLQNLELSRVAQYLVAPIPNRHEFEEVEWKTSLLEMAASWEEASGLDQKVSEVEVSASI